MLIILTGSDSINKRLISRQIMAKCNEYKCNGYTLDFSMDDPFGIKDKDNNYIAVEKFIEDNEENQKLFNTMEEMYKNFLLHEETNHYFDRFTDIGYDLKIFNRPEHLDRSADNFPNKESFNEILFKYKKSKLKYFVITGSFSKTIINKFIFKLGKENVKVINFLRNPSVAYFLNKKPKKLFLKDKQYTESYDISRLNTSILNSMILKDDENVQTIRFEDMIKSTLIIDNIDVGLYIDYKNKNDFLTTYEFDVKKDQIEMSSDELKKFNKLFSSFNVYEDMSEEEKALCNKFDLENINVFERLGYEQLTIKKMCSL